MTKEYLLPVLLLLTVGLVSLFGAKTNLDNPYTAEFVIAQDTIPLEDRQGDFLTNPSTNPFDLNDPAGVQQNVEYDPDTDTYILTETIGDSYFRSPTYMTFEEYLDYRSKQEQQKYFDVLGGKDDGTSENGLRDPLSKIDVKSTMLDRLFGGTEVDIRPQGSIDMTFGVDYQNVQNPALTPRQQRQGGFDFDMAIQMSVEGKIGEKLNLNTNYNTQATFDFDNQLKLDYDTDSFSEDEIIKNIEAGNVSMPLRSQLIQGAQSLFGLKTELQFGRLFVTAVASQQKSKNERITVQGGAQEQTFEIRADEYDENRHFFLSHYNRDKFEGALTSLPQIKSLFRLEKVQVFITNDIQDSEHAREIVALADLGEGDPTKITSSNTLFSPPTVPVNRDINGKPLPGNDANPLYAQLISNPRNALVDRVTRALTQSPFNLLAGQDFEKVSARKLEESQYSVNRELGFVSINVNVQPDQVVGISYQYSYNGEIYQVGEFADDVSTTQDDAASGQVLFCKMLKATTQRVDLPNWDLMMKNVYPTGAFQASPEEFYLDIFYEDPEGAAKPFLPDTRLEGIRLLNVFNLDNLNKQGDPAPDGVFDYVNGVTINSRNGRIMFPKLEPFGSDLAAQIDSESDSRKYTYPQLYSESKVIAREYAYLNRFVIKGRYKSSVSADISLGSFNIPEGSVTVSSSGGQLREGIDYEVDYGIGKVRILNDAILASGAPISIDFEDNSLFGFQSKTMVGLRADYKFNKDFVIGGTYLHLFERPYTAKVNAGDDPINNRIYGLDISLTKDAPWLTKLADKLPFYSTKTESKFTFQAEGAALKPGHSKAINEGTKDGNPDRDGGVVYIDDFEGATSSQDLRSNPIAWKMSSVPQYHPDFPEADQIDNLQYGMNRAKMAWYRINEGNQNDTNPYESTVSITEIFPNFTNPNTLGGQIDNRAYTFNMDYYPGEVGPYNFDTPNGSPYSAGADLVNGELGLLQPQTRWAGVMRALSNNDFQAANYEFIEFWALSPFLKEDGTPGAGLNADSNEGEILIHLGNISEDILRDSRKFYENGLPDPTASNVAPTVQTNWGRIPVQQQITESFSSDPEIRAAQDVGLDGLKNEEEFVKYADYVSTMTAANITINDPSHDNFVSYRDPNRVNDNVFDRYKDQNNPEGNSESAASGSNVSTAGDQRPDSEDLNRDFTLNETESYFEYRIPVKHGVNGEIDLTSNPYLTGDIRRDDGSNRIWYRFKIPLDQRGNEGDFFRSYNGIQDFRSIRFIRMVMKDWSQPTHFRMARFELVRNQWRRLTQFGVNDSQLVYGEDEAAGATFDVNEVSIEENDSKLPFGYILPPGVAREQAIGGINLNALQNEKSLALEVCGLEDGNAKAIYKNTAFDMRFYEGLKMFVHAEENPETVNLQDGDLTVFVRIGSDFTNNYYEYELPINISDPELNINNSQYTSEEYPSLVWPDENIINIDFAKLKLLKVARNAAGASFAYAFPAPENIQPTDNAYYRIKGNPNLGTVKSVMIGVRNPGQENSISPDEDGFDKCAEIWVNEMRVYGLDESGGLAGLARADFQIADLGNLSVSSQYSTQGWGALDQQLLERSREQIFKFDWAVDAELGKFFPEKSGIKVPFYYQDSREIKTPQFDPYDLDLDLKEKMSQLPADEAEIVKEQAQDYTRIKSMNFTNVRKEQTNTDAKNLPWNISNFSGTYAITDTEHRDAIVEQENIKTYRGAIDYDYSIKSKPIKPFKKLSKSKWLKLITDFNFNPLPNSVGFSTVMDREIGKTKYRFAGDNELYSTFYQKRWTWDRDYHLTWDFAKNIKFTFGALSTSVIDEAPADILGVGGINETWRGEIDTQYEKDLVWENIKGLGRDKTYKHNFSLNVTAPMKSIPILDWTTIKGSYKADYGWNASSLALQDSLGNVITNRQDRQVTMDLDFTKLYKKSKYLKKIDGKSRKPSKSPRSRSSEEGKKKAEGKDDKDKDKNKKKKENEPSKIERIAIRPLLLLRKGKISYKESFSTVLPGYMQDNPEYLGLSDNFTNPGWAFVAGLQPNIKQEDYYSTNDYLYNNYRLISTSIWQQQQVSQQYSRTLDLSLKLEPFKDFKIDLDMGSEYTRFHEESFKRDTIFAGTIDPQLNATQAEFHHLNPTDAGRYDISFFALNTFLGKDQDQDALYTQFVNNWGVMADELGGTNPNHLDSLRAAEGYPFGYAREHQDVLIPSFLAAYTGKDVKTYQRDIFKILPSVNWKLNYNGLSKVDAFKDVFKSFKLSHGYRSSMTVNQYKTDLLYDVNNQSKLNPNTQNFLSRYEIPEIVISEQFNPLIGVDMELKSGLSFSLDFNRTRNLAMSMERFSMSETRRKEYVFDFGYKLKEVDIPFLTGSKRKKKKPNAKPEEKKDEANQRGGRRGGNRGSGSAKPGDLDLSFTFALNDDITLFRDFFYENTQPNRGSRTLRFGPAAEYRLSKQLSLRLFFDYSKNTPKTTEGFPITNSQGGIVVRFILE